MLKRLAPFLAVLALAGCGGGHASKVGSAHPARKSSAENLTQSAMGSVHPPDWGSTPPGFVLPPQLPRAIPTATMFDAVTLSNVPRNPFAVAGYIAGNWPTWFSLAGDFPGAHRVSIAIHLGEHAMCGDFEPGDMDASQAGEWAKDDIAAGFKTPCEYGDLSNMPEIKASLAAALGSRWRAESLLWLAWYTDRPGLTPGYDADQYTDHALGLSLDENTVTLNFLRIASPPYVPPPVLPVCFTHHEAASVCAWVKAKVASDQRAAASSQRAYLARGCSGIRDRRNWFFQAIHRPPASKRAYRTAAYNTSVRAYVRQSCPTFGGWQGTGGRIGFFTGRAKQFQASN